MRSTVTLTFEEAAFGCKKRIEVDRIEKCTECDGTGAKKGTSVEACQTCHGTGQVETVQRTMIGMMRSSAPCSACHGTGRIIKSPCQACRGQGYVRRKRKIDVTFPAGIDEGQTVTISGQGSAGINGGPNGDIYATVTIRPHAMFRRRGSDVVSEVPISFVEAALGATIQVLTLDGKVEYNVPEGTQSGTVFRLKNKGIPIINSKARGDHYVTVKVEVLKNLNRKQKDILREFGQTLSPDNHTEENKSFFRKFK